MNKSIAFYLVAFLLVSIFVLSSFFQKGMFLDGLTYAAISRNLANGIGTMWEPHYTNTLYSTFYEHPPLSFWIQALFFKLFGDSFLTEKIFGLVTLFLTLLGMDRIWKLMARDKEESSYGWLPMVLLLLIPVATWSFKSNMLENTLTFFSLVTIFFALKSLVEGKWIYLFFASIFLICGLLTKGLVALFPLIFPLIFAFVYKRNKIGVIYFFLFFIIAGSLFVGLLLLFPEMKSNLSSYLSTQVFKTLKHERVVSEGTRFSILGKLFFEMLLPIILFLLVSISQFRRNGNLNFLQNKRALLMILIGLSASVPLIISQKQSNYYLLPSLPFFALAFGYYCLPAVKRSLFLQSARWTNIIGISAIAFSTVALSLALLKYGTYARDAVLQRDIELLSITVPKGTTISCSCDLTADWTFIAYMSRIGNISIDCRSQHTFAIRRNEHLSDASYLKQYELLDLPLKEVKLYKKKESGKNF